MRYDVYVDLPYELTRQQRSTVFEALDATVPGSGCVGRQTGSNDEVYFSIEARTEEEARERAERYMSTILGKAGLHVEYAITLQANRSDDD
jgi:hypothetical protein